jgi:K+-sensing histidine kinase KdpD
VEGLIVDPFFPYPHVVAGKRREGYLRSWPSRCTTCNRECERSETEGLALCSYGVNYYRFSKQLLVAGVVVRDYPRTSPARNKMLRKTTGDEPISAAEIEKARQTYLATAAERDRELRFRQEEAIEEYRRSKTFATDWLTSLRPEIMKALGQVHDYKQFVSQVIQNLNVILQTKYRGNTDEILEKATHEETSIYWAARLMEEKLGSALFLLNPERITDDPKYTQVHQMVTKYRKIYTRAFEAKKVRLTSIGSSFGYVLGNPKALGVIPHTFIDNALKYAPSGSEVKVSFAEDNRAISLSVSSYGPHILESEREKIFDPFYRGEAARRNTSEGTGFGLALAKVIAQSAGVEITFQQDPEETPHMGYATTFTAQFQREYPPWAEDDTSPR